jgi:hypothetical protein
VSSPFEALRGFRSEADERRAAEEAAATASAEAADTTIDEAPSDVSNGRIDALESSSADVSVSPDESIEEESEDSGPERESIEASQESSDRPGGVSEPPPNDDDDTRPVASERSEEKAERS